MNDAYPISQPGLARRFFYEMVVNNEGCDTNVASSLLQRLGITSMRINQLLARTALLLSIASLYCADSHGATTAASAEVDEHYFSVGTEPLDGTYSPKEGLSSRELFSGAVSRSEWESNLLKAWGVSSFPFEAQGVTWEGTPTRVKVIGLEKNEFGVHWRLDETAVNQSTASNGPTLFWSGDNFALNLLKPVPITLNGLDKQIVQLECQARGLELKHHLDNDKDGKHGLGQVWYLNPLGADDRRNIASPAKQGNTIIRTIAPFKESSIVLAGCSYRSDERGGGDREFRGPVLAYNRFEHRVHWRDAIDLESLRFLKIGNAYFFLSSWWCDACETSGFTLREFFFQGHPGEFLVIDQNSKSIGSVSSWFEGD